MDHSLPPNRHAIPDKNIGYIHENEENNTTQRNIETVQGLLSKQRLTFPFLWWPLSVEGMERVYQLYHG